MKPLAWNEIRGNWVPVLLPYNDREQIDYTLLEEEIEILLHYDVSGIYTNGTSSEFYNQTEEEFDRISEITAQRCHKAEKAFQIGVSHPSPWVSFQRAKRIASLEPGAIQLILPDWFAPNDREIRDFMTRMAEAAAPAGLVLYNPSFAKRVLQPHEWDAIKKDVPNLVGVKAAGGGAEWYREMREFAKEISVFIPGHHLASGLKQGAHGAYSNAACLHPQAAQNWYEQMQSNMAAALELEKRIQAFMESYIEPYITKQHYSHQAADRLLAMIGGWSNIGPRLRWPYQWIPLEEAVRLRPVAQEMLPEFFL